MIVIDIINKLHQNWRNIVILWPIVRTDKKEAISMLKKYITIFKQKESNVIFYNNISVLHLHQDWLHLDLNITVMLGENLLSRIRMFWCDVVFSKKKV